MKALLRPLVILLKLIRIMFYNFKNKTKIESTLASLKAMYGIDVLISQNTYVSSDVKIGDYSYVNKGSNIENCEIGRFCSISSGVYICPFEHNLNFRTTHPIIATSASNLKRNKVIIGNDVLVSLNTIILEGIHIGDGAVIGAGAVVTKDVEPYEIVGGIPAKHIRYRFDKDEIEMLLSIKWWDWDILKIKNNMEFLKRKSNSIIDHD